MSYSEWMRNHRTKIGIPLFLVCGWLGHLNPNNSMISTMVVACGEMLRIWAAGHLQKEKVFTTGGPYRFIRNPLYLGSFMIAIGFCLILDSLWIWAIVAGYFLFCYIPVVRYEEKTLAEKFPNEFPGYREVIPAFYPTIRIYPISTTQFSIRRIFRNKEYNSVLGILLVYAYLIYLRPRFSLG